MGGVGYDQNMVGVGGVLAGLIAKVDPAGWGRSLLMVQTISKLTQLAHLLSFASLGEA